MKKKIIYKDSDYKFGRPVGYIYMPGSGETPDSFYLYKDSSFTEKYTSEELKNFYFNLGIVIVKVQGSDINAAYTNFDCCSFDNDLYEGTITVGPDSFAILPKEAEDSQG